MDTTPSSTLQIKRFIYKFQWPRLDLSDGEVYSVIGQCYTNLQSFWKSHGACQFWPLTPCLLVLPYVKPVYSHFSAKQWLLAYKMFRINSVCSVGIRDFPKQHLSLLHVEVVGVVFPC